MNAQTYNFFLDKLENGSNQEKVHAAARLKMPDAVGFAANTAATIEYPSLIEQAKSLGAAVMGVAGDLLRGEPVLVSREEKDRRLAICQECEFFDAGQARCTRCGCFTGIKDWLASQSCPIGKWAAAAKESHAGGEEEGPAD